MGGRLLDQRGRGRMERGAGDGGGTMLGDVREEGVGRGGRDLSFQSVGLEANGDQQGHCSLS